MDVRGVGPVEWHWLLQIGQIRGFPMGIRQKSGGRLMCAESAPLLARHKLPSVGSCLYQAWQLQYHLADKCFIMHDSNLPPAVMQFYSLMSVICYKLQTCVWFVVQSIFILRKPRSPLILSRDQAFLGVSRLPYSRGYTHSAYLYSILIRKIGGSLQTGCNFPKYYTRLQNERWPVEGDVLQTGGACITARIRYKLW